MNKLKWWQKILVYLASVLAIMIFVRYNTTTCTDGKKVYSILFNNPTFTLTDEVTPMDKDGNIKLVIKPINVKGASK